MLMSREIEVLIQFLCSAKLDYYKIISGPNHAVQGEIDKDRRH